MYELPNTIEGEDTKGWIISFFLLLGVWYGLTLLIAFSVGKNVVLGWVLILGMIVAPFVVSWIVYEAFELWDEIEFKTSGSK